MEISSCRAMFGHTKCVGLGIFPVRVIEALYTWLPFTLFVLGGVEIWNWLQEPCWKFYWFLPDCPYVSKECSGLVLEPLGHMDSQEPVASEVPLRLPATFQLSDSDLSKRSMLATRRSGSHYMGHSRLWRKKVRRGFEGYMLQIDS